MNNRNERPDWYRALENQPHTRTTFTKEMMNQVESRIIQHTSNRNNRKIKLASAAALLAVAAILIVMMLPRINEQVQTTDEITYNPNTVKVGDTVGGWKAAEIRKGDYGIGSVQTIFEGDLEVSGTYEYSTQENPYQPNEILFQPDEASQKRLPAIETAPGYSQAFVLQFVDPGEKERFGTPGATGSATIAISRYSSVYAEILEGTSNSGKLKTINKIDATPAPDTHLTNQELASRLQPFPLFKGGSAPEISDPDLQLVGGWLKEVERHYIVTLSDLSNKKINSEQRNLVKAWLEQVFNGGKVQELLDQTAPERDNGYWISGGTLNLLPPGEIKEITNPQIQNSREGHKLYNALLVLTGTHDALLQCDFTIVDGKLKISSSSYKLQ